MNILVNTVRSKISLLTKIMLIFQHAPKRMASTKAQVQIKAKSAMPPT